MLFSNGTSAPADSRCCACPETKNKRDECFFNTSPDEASIKCQDYIQAHRACMAGFGFKV